MQVKYTIVIQGVMESDNENKAKLTAELGVNLSARLLRSPVQITVATEDVTKEYNHRIEQIKSGVPNGRQ